MCEFARAGLSAKDYSGLRSGVFKNRMGVDELKPQEDLVGYFELTSGKSIRTREDLEKYFGCVQEVRPQWLHVNRVPGGWPLAQQIILALLFAFAVVQYYFVDVVSEISSLHEVIYFVPPAKPRTTTT